MRTMKAAVFVEPGRIVLDEKPVPEVGPGDALIRVTTTTICGTDVHILKGEYPVERGRSSVTSRSGSSRSSARAVTRLPDRPARDRRRDHAVRPVLRLPRRPHVAMRRDTETAIRTRWAAGASATRSTAARRSTSRSRRDGQPGAGAGPAHRRAGPDVPGHHEHRLRRRGERPHSASATRSRCSRRDRSACAPPPAPSSAGATQIFAVDGVPAAPGHGAAPGADVIIDYRKRRTRSPRSCA